MQATIESTPAQTGRRLPGYRVVLAVFLVGLAVGGVVILTGVIMGGNAEEDLICKPDPAACATVRNFAEAFNASDPARVESLVTERFMETRLRSDSSTELTAWLSGLTDEMRFEEFRVTTVSAGEEEAFVTARFVVDGYDYETKYRLVKVDGRWLIDQ
jgi:hypothetical protein